MTALGVSCPRLVADRVLLLAKSCGRLTFYVDLTLFVMGFVHLAKEGLELCCQVPANSLWGGDTPFVTLVPNTKARINASP